ncbi:Baeyer-Villiger monooxygenase [Paraconexibacter sp. AEG42_29]|uniref:flavin-containing monooxygenase n=1 Tax=Paraconexibacter sp. AEG42_29 TaxID=2997339 RepID=UPI00339DA19D
MTTATTTPTVAIIGAGFGGLAAAIELKRHGIGSFTVLERSSRVGGVWQANSYPGAACDVPSVIYQFSFALKPDWSRRFGTQDEIRAYLEQVAVEFRIVPHIRFGTTVTAAVFDEATATWAVSTDDGVTANYDVLIGATGQLSRPKTPDVPGRAAFRGAQFHSAEWDHSVDLTGKRVAVVGGGASAIQVVPAIVDAAAHVTVVQRTPSWVVNKWDWTPGRLEQRLMRSPAAQRAYHNAMWLWFESRYPVVKRSLRPLRRVWEAKLRRTIRRTLKDPRKVAAATPGYEMGCNRLLLSREWYPALARPDVDVVGAGLSAMDAGGLTCDDGTRVDADVIVWCTGFTATEYLAPIEIRGVGGQTIREAWADGPEAYLGLSTPGFPNLLMSYGPNTNSLTNTIVYLLEQQASYMRQAIEHLARVGGAIDVRSDVHDAFNAELQQRLGRTVFTTGCPGWYATASGKVTQVWTGSHVEYGRRTRRFDPACYVHVPRSADRATGAAGEDESAATLAGHR